jgi:hypothetical protein
MGQKGYVGDLHDAGQDGGGWSGVTQAEKDWAAGLLYEDHDGWPLDRMTSAVLNTNEVAAKRGSGYWTQEYIRRVPLSTYDD